jgi:hypothetical protein
MNAQPFWLYGSMGPSNALARTGAGKPSGQLKARVVQIRADRRRTPRRKTKEMEREVMPGVESGKRHISGKENTEHET